MVSTWNVKGKAFHCAISCLCMHAYLAQRLIRTRVIRNTLFIPTSALAESQLPLLLMDTLTTACSRNVTTYYGYTISTACQPDTLTMKNMGSQGISLPSATATLHSGKKIDLKRFKTHGKNFFHARAMQHSVIVLTRSIRAGSGLWHDHLQCTKKRPREGATSTPLDVIPPYSPCASQQSLKYALLPSTTLLVLGFWKSGRTIVHRHTNISLLYCSPSGTSSSPTIWFRFCCTRSCLRSRAALVLARFASISSFSRASRCFSALALWIYWDDNHQHILFPWAVGICAGKS